MCAAGTDGRPLFRSLLPGPRPSQAPQIKGVRITSSVSQPIGAPPSPSLSPAPAIVSDLSQACVRGLAFIRGLFLPHPALQTFTSEAHWAAARRASGLECGTSPRAREFHWANSANSPPHPGGEELCI